MNNLPGPRCKEMVDGGLLSWPCMLPMGHDGPHQAVEAPASIRRRDAWLESQGVPSADAGVQLTANITADASLPISDDAGVLGSLLSPSSIPTPPATPSVPSLDPASINDVERRVQAITGFLSKDLERMPSPVASWVMGMLSHTSLLALWEMSQKEFAAGAPGVTLTPEFLDRLVPAPLRSYLGRS